MAIAVRPFFCCAEKGTSRFMGPMVAWYKSATHCTSGTMVGSGGGYPNKVRGGICAIDNIGVFLFWCHAYGPDSTRAALESILCELDEIACCGILLVSDTSLWYRGRGVNARCSLHSASVRLVGDEGTGDNLDGCMVVSHSTTSDCAIPGVVVLAPLPSARESSTRTLRQRLVDLVISVDRAGHHDCSTEQAKNMMPQAYSTR